MALITKMHRCAFCGSSEVTVSENGTYTCRDCGKTPVYTGRKGTAEEYQANADEIMRRADALGGIVCR